MHDADGVRSVALVATDVTAAKQAEIDRALLEEQMRHAQKLESLGILAGGIAHDFNNLLMCVAGNAELALQTSRPMTAGSEYLSNILEASNRASVLCQQMLAYSGKGKLEVAALDLSALVRDIVQLLTVSVPKDVSFECDLDTTLGLIEADSAQLQQVVMNLITNASESTQGAGGIVRLTTGSRQPGR